MGAFRLVGIASTPTAKVATIAAKVSFGDMMGMFGCGRKGLVELCALKADLQRLTKLMNIEKQKRMRDSENDVSQVPDL